MPLTPFHLAITVSDLARARYFYGELLGCAEGRSAETWVDFDFFGHQLVCHLKHAEPQDAEYAKTQDTPASSSFAVKNQVDGHGVPVPHFGVILEMPEWQALADKLQTAGQDFIIAPYLRFQGQVGEQATMFFLDPDGHALEFKGFQDIASELFARD